jgi:Cof subfamily protein (haloacid dehalogenase superfamily)
MESGVFSAFSRRRRFCHAIAAGPDPSGSHDMKTEEVMEMNEIRIAFFDIDGTLVDMEWKKMTETMRQTLITLQKRGIKICIASGRPPIYIPPFPGVSFDAFMTFNGSYCYDREGKVIHSHAIPRQDVKRIIANAAVLSHPCIIAGKDRMSARQLDRNLIDYIAISGNHMDPDDGFEDFLESEDIYQMMCGCVREEYDTVMAGADGAEITAWWDRAVDIIPKGSGKKIGVEKILDYFHLSRDQAMAFGDGGNDIGMLTSVGVGVAMGNGTPDVKAAVPYTCPSVREEGIYQFCKQYQLI